MHRNDSGAVAVPVTWVRKGRGAVSNIAHRFESVAREPTAMRPKPSGSPRWRATMNSAARCGHRRRPRRGEIVDHLQRVARHRVRSVDQSVSGLRARLHLLLRAADAQLSESVAGPRLRDQAGRQAQRGRTAARELAAPSYRPEVIALGVNTDAYQPIERELQAHARRSSKCSPQLATRSGS